jgi:sortase B
LESDDIQNKETIPEGTSYPAPQQLADASPEVINKEAPDTLTESGAKDALLAYYQSLVEKNADFIGWITIENTAVDYPVMYTQEVPEKYLHRDFEGRYSFAGLPFLDARCDLGELTANTIIYAHNMHSGQIFAEVTKYLEPDFLKKHPAVRFDTLTFCRVYEVIAVLQIDLKPLSDPSMLCYSTFDTTSKNAAEELNQYLTHYAQVQIGKVQAGDRILTLSTCKRVGSLDRLVIICRSTGKE